MVDGPRYGYRDPRYPTMHEAHLYSREGTDARERAFLGMLHSAYGQERFVADAPDLVRVDAAER